MLVYVQTVAIPPGVWRESVYVYTCSNVYSVQKLKPPAATQPDTTYLFSKGVVFGSAQTQKYALWPLVRSLSLSVCRCQWAMRGLRNTTESVVQPTPFAAERQSIAASPARHTHTVVCIVCRLCHTTTLRFALWFCSPTPQRPPPNAHPPPLQYSSHLAH